MNPELAAKLLLEQEDEPFDAGDYVKAGGDESIIPVYDGPVVRIVIPLTVHTLNDYFGKNTQWSENTFKEAVKKGPFYAIRDLASGNSMVIQFETRTVIDENGSVHDWKDRETILTQEPFADAQNGLVQHFQAQIAAKKNPRQAVANLVLLGRSDLAVNYGRYLGHAKLPAGKAIEAALAAHKAGHRQRNKIARFMQGQQDVEWGNKGFYLLFDDWVDTAPFFGHDRQYDYKKNAEKLFSGDAYEWFDANISFKDAWDYVDDKNENLIRQLLVGRACLNDDEDEFVVTKEDVDELNNKEIGALLDQNRDGATEDIANKVVQAANDVEQSSRESAYMQGYQSALLAAFGQNETTWKNAVNRKGEKISKLAVFVPYSTLEEWLDKWKDDNYDEEFDGQIHDLALDCVDKVMPNDDYYESFDSDYFNDQLSEGLGEIDMVQPDHNDPNQPELPLEGEPEPSQVEPEYTAKVSVGEHPNEKVYKNIPSTDAAKYVKAVPNTSMQAESIVTSLLEAVDILPEAVTGATRETVDAILAKIKEVALASESVEDFKRVATERLAHYRIQFEPYASMPANAKNFPGAVSTEGIYLAPPASLSPHSIDSYIRRMSRVLFHEMIHTDQIDRSANPDEMQASAERLILGNNGELNLGGYTRQKQEIMAHAGTLVDDWQEEGLSPDEMRARLRTGAWDSGVGHSALQRTDPKLYNLFLTYASEYVNRIASPVQENEDDDGEDPKEFLDRHHDLGNVRIQSYRWGERGRTTPNYDVSVPQEEAIKHLNGEYIVITWADGYSETLETLHTPMRVSGEGWEGSRLGYVTMPDGRREMVKLSRLPNVVYDYYRPIEITPGVRSTFQPLQRESALQEAMYKLSTTQISLPEDIEQHIISWGKLNIPDDAVYTDEDGSKGRENEGHISVLYGLIEKEPSAALGEIVAKTKPFLIELAGVSIFEGPEYDVVKIDVISEELTNLSSEIRAACPNENTFPEYHGHATIAYVKKGRGKEFVGQDVFKDAAVKRDFWAYDIEFHGAGDSEDPDRVTEVLHFDKSGDPGHAEPANADQRYPQATEEVSESEEEVDPKTFVNSGYIIRYNPTKPGEKYSYVVDQRGGAQKKRFSGPTANWGMTDDIQDAHKFFSEAEAKEALTKVTHPIWLKYYSIEPVNESEEVDPKEFVKDVSVDFGYWHFVDSKRDQHGQINDLYGHRNGRCSFRLKNTFFGEDQFTEEMLRDYSVFAYDGPVGNGTVVDGYTFERDSPEKALSLAVTVAEKMITKYTPKLLYYNESEEVDPKKFVNSGYIIRYDTGNPNAQFSYVFDACGGRRRRKTLEPTGSWGMTRHIALAEVFFSEAEAREVLVKLTHPAWRHNYSIEPVNESEEVDPKEFLTNSFGWIAYYTASSGNTYLVAWDYEYAGGHLAMQGTWTQIKEKATRFSSENEARDAIDKLGIGFHDLTVELVANDSVPADDMKPNNLGEKVDEATVREPAYMIRIGDGVRTKYFCTDGSKSWWSDHYEDAAALPHAQAVAQIDSLRARKHMSASVIRLESIDDQVNESQNPFDDDGLPGEVSSFLRKVRSKRRGKPVQTL